MGIVTFSRDDDVDLATLVDTADRAMYEAKRAGGGRFRFAGEPPSAGADVAADDHAGVRSPQV